MNNSTHLNFVRWLSSPTVRLSASQSVILRRSPVRQVDISRDLNISGAGVSSAVDAMVKRGLVRRQETEDDRRVVLIIREKEGDRLIAEMEAIFAGATLDPVAPETQPATPATVEDPDSSCKAEAEFDAATVAEEVPELAETSA